MELSRGLQMVNIVIWYRCHNKISHSKLQQEFLLFVLCLCHTLWCSMLPLTLCSGITPGGGKGSYVILVIKSGLATCKASKHLIPCTISPAPGINFLFLNLDFQDQVLMGAFLVRLLSLACRQWPSHRVFLPFTPPPWNSIYGSSYWGHQWDWMRAWFDLHLLFKSLIS